MHNLLETIRGFAERHSRSERDDLVFVAYKHEVREMVNSLSRFPTMEDVLNIAPPIRVYGIRVEVVE